MKDIDGASITSLLKGEADATLARRTLYFHYPHHRNSATHSAAIQGDHKFFRFYERPGSLYLYNLGSNIGESENLSAAEPGVAARLQQQMDRYFDSIKACLPRPNPQSDPKYIPFDPDAPEQDARAASGNSPPEPTAEAGTERTQRQLQRDRRKEQRSPGRKPEHRELQETKP